MKKIGIVYTRGPYEAIRLIANIFIQCDALDDLLR